MPCEPSQLSGLELFERLDPEDRLGLAQSIDALRLDPGATLFRAGEPGESLYVVKKGEIELFIKDTVGQKISLAVVGAGEMFGELALLDSGPRSATAVALIETELLELRRDELLVMFRKSPESALALLGAMGHMTRKADELLKTRVSRNPNEEVEEKLTALDHIADWIAAFSGSMPFLLLNTAWFTIWIALNTLPLGVPQFDPFPFGLLTMIVSLEAIFLSCFLLLSQSRQAQKERVRSDIEYEVNIKAELEVAHLHEKIDRIHAEMLERFQRVEKLLGKTWTGAPLPRQ